MLKCLKISFRERCHCTHRVKVPKGSLVEMVLVNEMKGEGAEGHPIHAHGQHFHLLGMGKVRVPWTKLRQNLREIFNYLQYFTTANFYSDHHCKKRYVKSVNRNNETETEYSYCNQENLPVVEIFLILAEIWLSFFTG